MNIFGIGPVELLFILILGLLVVGPERLPEVARFLGRTLAQVLVWFQRSPTAQLVTEVRGDIQSEISELRDELFQTQQRLKNTQQQLNSGMQQIQSELVDPKNLNLSSLSNTFQLSQPQQPNQPTQSPQPSQEPASQEPPAPASETTGPVPTVGRRGYARRPLTPSPDASSPEAKSSEEQGEQTEGVSLRKDEDVHQGAGKSGRADEPETAHQATHQTAHQAAGNHIDHVDHVDHINHIDHISDTSDTDQSSPPPEQEPPNPLLMQELQLIQLQVQSLMADFHALQTHLRQQGYLDSSWTPPSHTMHHENEQHSS